MEDSQRAVPVKKKRGHIATPEATAERIAKLRLAGKKTTKAEAALRSPDRVLTEKQRMFAKHWAAGETPRAACIRAGYTVLSSEATKVTLMNDPAVLKIYHVEKALYESAANMSRKKVMDGFLEAADMARTLADPTALTGAFREIGKMCGYYEPSKRTIDINVSGNVTMKKLESMGDAELLALIKGEVEDVVFTELEAQSEEAEDDK